MRLFYNFNAFFGVYCGCVNSLMSEHKPNLVYRHSSMKSHCSTSSAQPMWMHFVYPTLSAKFP